MQVKTKHLTIFISIFLLLNCSGINFAQSSDKRLKIAKEFIFEQKYSKAKQELEYIIFNDPLSKYANKAQFYLAESEFYLKNYKDAMLEYNNYLKQPFQELQLTIKAEYMLCKCWYELSNDVLRDQTSTYVALDKLQYYIEKKTMKGYSDEISDMIKNLRNKLAQKEFDTANLYFQLEQYEAAKVYFKNIINEFYDTDYINDALLNIALIIEIDSNALAIK